MSAEGANAFGPGAVRLEGFGVSIELISRRRE